MVVHKYPSTANNNLVFPLPISGVGSISQAFIISPPPPQVIFIHLNRSRDNSKYPGPKNPFDPNLYNLQCQLRYISFIRRCLKYKDSYLERTRACSWMASTLRRRPLSSGRPLRLQTWTLCRRTTWRRPGQTHTR